MPSLIFIVPARIFLGVSANAAQKRLLLKDAPVRLIWNATYAAMAFPAMLLCLTSRSMPPASFWGNVFAGGFLDAIGNLAMVASLRATDLSIFGPLNAFRPALALAFGWALLGEMPTMAGGAGIAITVFGAIMLLRTDARADRQKARNPLTRVVLFRVAGVALSTTGAVYLKRAVKSGTIEWTLAGWIFCGLLCLMIVSFAHGKPFFAGSAAGFRQCGNGIPLHSALFLAMQWCTIRIFRETLLAYSFVFFQLGMVLQVIAGRMLFREPHFRRRMMACIIMGLGSTMILWKG